MKVIIPASGTGERFKRSGYGVFKALLKVNDKHVMDYIIDSFDVEDEFFIISSIETYNEMDAYLSEKNINFKHLLYTGPKEGPVGAIYNTGILSELISDNEEIMISYCDFGFEWDYEDFKNFVKNTKCDGAIPCYSGFHPHLVKDENVYACCKHLDGEVYEVIEKYKSDVRYEEMWSAGLYYFSKFSTMMESFSKMIEAKDTLNSEYYVSKAYNHIISDDYNIRVYPGIEKFYQFGTPSDFEYAKKKLESRNFVNDEDSIDNIVVLSAGKGERFLNLNFTQPKPFLPLNNKPLVLNIKDTFDHVKGKVTFVASDAHKIFWDNLPNENISYVKSNKIGAAYSYKSACESLEGETLIVPCDLVAKHITKKFIELKEDADAIIFTSTPSSYNIDKANSFAWVYSREFGSGKVSNIGIKQRLSYSNDYEEKILIGSFWVKDNSLLIDCIDAIFEEEYTVNGEYYLDNAFKYMGELGLNVKYINIDNYYSFGTPEEYYENKYWFEIKE